jgi:hypothetical protein
MTANEKRLREQLLKYGGHSDSCMAEAWEGCACRCGWEDVKQAALAPAAEWVVCTHIPGACCHGIYEPYNCGCEGCRPDNDYRAAQPADKDECRKALTELTEIAQEMGEYDTPGEAPEALCVCGHPEREHLKRTNEHGLLENIGCRLCLYTKRTCTAFRANGE